MYNYIIAPEQVNITFPLEHKVNQHVYTIKDFLCVIQIIKLSIQANSHIQCSVDKNQSKDKT